MGGWEIGEGVGWAERGFGDYLDAGLPVAKSALNPYTTPPPPFVAQHACDATMPPSIAEITHRPPIALRTPAAPRSHTR
jgi:hypothetical protein